MNDIKTPLVDCEKFKLVENHDKSIEDFQGSSLSFYKDAWIRFRKNKAAFIALIALLIFIIIALIAPALGNHGLANYEGFLTNKDHIYLPPKIPHFENMPFWNGKSNGIDLYQTKNVTTSYLFGTDYLGRDLMVRVFRGSQISLLFGLAIALIDILVGGTIGAILGYYGGKVDIFGQRFIEILGSIPSLIWVVLILMMWGAGIWQLMLALSINGWIPMCRIVRAQVLKLKEQEFIYVARTLGTSNITIIIKHIIPNTIGVVIIWLMFTIPSAIFTESFLSFLGLGLSVPMASLGTLINEGREYFLNYPYLFFIPAFILSFVMLSLNLIGDGLRDAFDPKMRGGQ